MWKNKFRIFKTAYKEVVIKKKTLILLLCLFFSYAFYPTYLTYYQGLIKDKSRPVYAVEHYIRYINTAAQVLIPIILFDKIGMVQAIYVGIGTTVSLHVLKRAFNDVTIMGTRLGQRPSSTSSRHNVPSGHSAMASSAMAFIIIRYGWKHGYYLIPICLLTMWVRILLKAHTVSAVVSGAILGIIIALLLTSKYKVDKD
jgi:membrane-associated phospholipid phosphatase